MTSTLNLLIVVCFFAMISPGPDFLLVTRNALRYPRAKALATAFGIVAGCFVHATYCILGIAFVITQSVVLFSTVKYAGAGYLIYLGVKGLCAKKESLPVQQQQPKDEISVRQAFVEGLLCNVLNPKLAVFLLSLFTQFIAIDANLGEKLLVCGVFIGESALYWPTLVLALQSRAVRQTYSRAKLAVDRLCGGLLLYLGLKVALSRG